MSRALYSQLQAHLASPISLLLTLTSTPGPSHLSPAHTNRHTWPLPSLSCSHLQAHLASPISLLLTPAGTSGHSHLSPAHTCRHIWTFPSHSRSHLQAHLDTPISLPLTPAGTPSLSHLVPAQPSWLLLGSQEALLAEVGFPQTLCPHDSQDGSPASALPPLLFSIL